MTVLASCAISAACLRSRSPNLTRTRLTWVLVVGSATTSRSAISSMSGIPPNRTAKPSRTTIWSSAISTRTGRRATLPRSHHRKDPVRVTTGPHTSPTQRRPGMLAPYQLTSGGRVSSYSDVQKAVRVEKFRIWFAWVSGGIIMLIIANGTKNIAILGVITEVLFFVGGILFTITAVRMTNALNRKAETARREVLGDL